MYISGRAMKTANLVVVADVVSQVSVLHEREQHVRFVVVDDDADETEHVLVFEVSHDDCLLEEILSLGDAVHLNDQLLIALSLLVILQKYNELNN